MDKWSVSSSSLIISSKHNIFLILWIKSDQYKLTFDIQSHNFPAYIHSDTGQDGTARGVAHYNWFYKYLGLAT